jgi:hypothetical protein
MLSSKAFCMVIIEYSGIKASCLRVPCERGLVRLYFVCLRSTGQRISTRPSSQDLRFARVLIFSSFLFVTS